jgi:hypothetical protein
MMDECREFYTLHLPHLINYVVPVLQSKNGGIEIGSGVLVNVRGRHLIATARHCIDADVRVVRSATPIQQTGTTTTKPLRILDKGWHDTLDLGYLETADPECAELGWDQLCSDRIVDGMVQIVGYPEVLVEAIHLLPGKLTDVSLAAGTFGTTIKKQTEDRLTFDYPKVGSKYNETTGTWHESPFPKTPKGFSGGACFGLTNPPGRIAQVQYKLLAIQYAWDAIKCDKVFAVSISRWIELLTERGLA